MASQKFIHNPTGSDRFYLGVPVPAGGSREIPKELYPNYATLVGLITDVEAGTVTISKDGTNPLSATLGSAWLTTVYPAPLGGFNNENNNFSATDIQAAIEEAATLPNPTTDIRGTTISRTFYRSGNPGNKWLQYHEDTSDDVPAVIPFDCKLIALSFTNDNTGVDCGVELFKNGTSSGNRVIDWTINNKQSAYKTNNLDAITFSAGDTLAVFIDDEGTNGNDAIVVVELLVTSTTTGEG